MEEVDSELLRLLDLVQLGLGVAFLIALASLKKTPSQLFTYVNNIVEGPKLFPVRP